MKRFSLALLPFAIAACGGGTSDSSPSPAPASASQSASIPETVPVVAAPAPAAATTEQSPGPGVPAATGCDLSGFQQEIMNRINAARANSRMCGTDYYAAATPLTWNAKLYAAAAGHAADMGQQDYFSHTSLDGRTFDLRIAATGYEWSTVGENIAAGQTSIEQAMNAWLGSPGHCANIMNGNYTEVGASCVKNADSTYKLYWAMEFGRPAQGG